MQLLKDYGIQIIEITQAELDALADKVRTQTWEADFKLYGEKTKDYVYAYMGWELN